MKAKAALQKKIRLPIIIEKDEDGFYVAECTLLSGCFTQGKTLAEAMVNIKGVIALCLEDKNNRTLLRSYSPQKVTLRSVLV